jgi:large subunit ribosomal protein L7A
LISQLETEHKVVGVKQSRRAVLKGEARLVFLAEDADPQVTEPIQALCSDRGVPVQSVPHMKELGSACGIRLGCAVAALLAE